MGAKAGYEFDPTTIYCAVMAQRRKDEKERNDCAREMRGYQYDNHQRNVDRKIGQDHHDEAMTAAREDKDWRTKIQSAYVATTTAWWRSLVYSLLVILVVDVLRRCLAVYQVFNTLSVQEFLCYGMEETSHEQGSFSFTRIDRFGQTMFPQDDYKSTCPKTAALRLISIIAFYVLLAGGMSILRNVALLGNWQHLLSVAAHVVALSLNGWLPTKMISFVSTGVVTIYMVAYLVVGQRYRSMCREMQPAKGNDSKACPSTAVVNQRLMMYEDVTSLCQVLPFIVGTLWAAALYVMYF
jgi:hypothetical protein